MEKAWEVEGTYGPNADPQSGGAGVKFKTDWGKQVEFTIVAAVTEPSTPFRQLVGSDAELIAGVKSSMSFEDFEATMRTTLDWHD